MKTEEQIVYLGVKIGELSARLDELEKGRLDNLEHEAAMADIEFRIAAQERDSMKARIKALGQLLASYADTAALERDALADRIATSESTIAEYLIHEDGKVHPCIILLYHCSQCDNEFEREFKYGEESESVKCLVCGEWGHKVRAIGCLMREEREETT